MKNAKRRLRNYDKWQITIVTSHKLFDYVKMFIHVFSLYTPRKHYILFCSLYDILKPVSSHLITSAFTTAEKPWTDWAGTHWG